MTIAIVGAGLAGLSCAQRLAGAGVSVRLFDKGRGPGGRMSSRRASTPLGELRFDHGAPYFEAASADFATVVESWISAGAAAPWSPRTALLNETGLVVDERSTQRIVGTPGMSAILRHLAADLDVQWTRRVETIEGDAGAWQLRFEDGGVEGPFEAVFVAVPAEQATPLLHSIAPIIAEIAQQIESVPCWSAMLAFDRPMEIGFDLAEGTHGPLARLIREASKPGRASEEAWTIQASTNWSRTHLELDPDAAKALLVDAFRALTGAPEPLHAAAHRWRYARPTNAPGCACRLERSVGIGACGDWHLGDSAEAAWQSGQALAKTWLG